MHNVIAAGGGFFLFEFWRNERVSCSLWRCVNQDQDEICKDMDTECIGDLCDEYKRCSTCSKRDNEDCPQY